MTDTTHAPEDAIAPRPRPPRLFFGCLGLLLIIGLWGAVTGVMVWWEYGSQVNYQIAILMLYLLAFFTCLRGLYHLKKWGYHGMLLVFLLSWLYEIIISTDELFPIQIHALLLILLVHIGRPRLHTLLT